MEKILMNREDIKYVRKMDVSRKPSVYQDWVVQTSSDNVNWYNLVVDVDEWLVDLIVDALNEDRQFIGYSSTGNRMYRE